MYPSILTAGYIVAALWAFAGYSEAIMATRYKQTILDVHNNYRANVEPPSNKMLKLKWGIGQAKKAEALVKSCPPFVRQTAKYSTELETPTDGQNFFAYIGPVNWKNIVDNWGRSAMETFEYEGGDDFKPTIDDKQYAQLVAGDAKTVGCASHRCPGGWAIFACNYDPVLASDKVKKPYENGEKQSCEGCKAKPVCETKGPFAGKLLISCG